VKTYKDNKIAEKTVLSGSTKSKNRKNILNLVEKYGYSTEDKKRLADDIGISLATLYRWIKSEENKNENNR
jgi:hypothetical protein